MATHRCIVTILALGCVSPEPEPAPEPAAPPPVTSATEERKPSLIQRSNGTCALVRSSHCPEGARCNPPPPKPHPCPPLTTTALVRLDEGCEQRGTWQCDDDDISCDGRGRLAAECPPVLADAAPRSQLRKHSLYGCTLSLADGSTSPVLCPPDMERPPAPNVSIQRGEDGVCLAERSVTCPANLPCDPPEPQAVTCPPDLR